ncbi:head-tail connector protein [Algicella marina]|uniref:Phage gp6-like head-tail connector protein n=1 Tax=Algicella marina TaxID=2683284 RepID=A0A6P1SV32_9RHOB|nr:head-tail connector protein [Algicella marina]QHQ34554.1 hypothetical protein GO499_04785 [Algicella marina]
MNLTEITSPPAAAYPVRALADHLRLGTGFADDGSQDALLEAYLVAAIAAVEARTGKVILERDYLWEIARWHSGDRQGLPVAPVQAVNAVSLIDFEGGETLIDAGRYRLRPDGLRPELVAGVLPAIPHNGMVRIAFTAGYGPVWEDAPADIRQAVLLLAAHYYEYRSIDGAEREMPFGVSQLLARFQTLRLTGDRL